MQKQSKTDDFYLSCLDLSIQFPISCKCCGSFWTDSCFIFCNFCNRCICLLPVRSSKARLQSLQFKRRQGAECDDSSCPTRMSPQRHLLLPFLAKLDSEHIRSTVYYVHFRPRWSFRFLSKASKDWSFIRASWLAMARVIQVPVTADLGSFQSCTLPFGWKTTLIHTTFVSRLATTAEVHEDLAFLQPCSSCRCMHFTCIFLQPPRRNQKSSRASKHPQGHLANYAPTMPTTPTMSLHKVDGVGKHHCLP